MCDVEVCVVFLQAEDGIRDLVRSRGLGDVYKRQILMGFGLNSDNIHSPNEKYGLFNYYKGIETLPWFFKYYSEME